MRKKHMAFGFSSVFMLIISSPSLAHHSFAAEFDINRPIKLEGVVTRMEWSNPHSWVHLEITLDNGEKQQWMIEGGAPNDLLRRGWSRDSLPVGTFIEIEGFQARDRSNKANGRTVILPNGSRLFVGSGDASQ